MGIIIAVLIFSVLVLFHEFGHFIFAKRNGIIVTEFSIGMGPKIAGFTKGDTLFAWRLLPFGGACMMAGEDDGDIAEGTFNSRSVWARMSVILAGPIFNFILAFFFAMVIIGYTGYTPPDVAAVEEGSPAEQAGLQAGDVIKKIDNWSVRQFKDVQLHMSLYPGQTYEITYMRDGVKTTVDIEPFYDDALGRYRVGINAQGHEAGIGKMLQYGLYEVEYNIRLVVKTLGMLVQGQVTRNDVAGPVGIVTMIDETYEETKEYGVTSVVLTMMNLAVILSANLGVMNLLPIPALDGGRFLFLIIEAVRGKPIDREKEGLVHFVGFALLMVLMVLVLFNDISRLFA